MVLIPGFGKNLDSRWMVINEGRLEEPGPVSALSLHSLPSAVCLATLQSLYVECKDSYGLRRAVRKLDFPNLRDLSLVFVGILDGLEQETCELPLPEKLFYEPRLIKLTRLLLQNFTLNPSHVVQMLSYLQSLESLSIVDCQCTRF